MMHPLQLVDELIVDVAVDNVTDSYSSKPAHVSPEFNNVIATATSPKAAHESPDRYLGFYEKLTGSKGGQGMKIDILRILAVLLCGFLFPSLKRKTAGRFLPTKSHRGLGQKELERFIHW